MRGLIIVVLIVGSYWWFWGRMDGAVKVIDAQLQALSQRDFTTAYDYLSTETKNTLSLEEFLSRVGKHDPVMDSANSQFWSRSMDGDVATISGTIESLSTKQTKAQYVLVKEDGRWVIRSFSYQ